MRIRARMDRFASNWIRRRQGPDRGAVTLRRGRIYILPTGLGAAFGLMLFAMLLGSLNYANNMGLALTFLLAALGVAAMHACHRNLESLVARAAGAEPPYRGQRCGVPDRGFESRARAALRPRSRRERRRTCALVGRGRW